MKKSLYIFTLVFTSLVWGQEALYNIGSLQLHNNSQIGFHTDFINDGDFNQTSGLVGFYNDSPLFVQGTNPITLYDVEFAVQGELFLENTISINNNANFILGNVITSQDSPEYTLNFNENAFFTGENDAAKVVGFAGVSAASTFSFPIGDQDQLRSVLLNSNSTSDFASSAYFFDSPNGPNAYNQAFDINTKIGDIGFVSNTEFWVVNSNTNTNITLSWNTRSNLSALTTALEDLIVVGWNKATNRWTSLGNAAIGGDLNEGFITSENFLPDDYAAITFGTLPLPLDTFATNNPTLGNYFISPNEDGTNDFLVFDNLDDTGTNQVLIYNKFGQKVFQMTNYTNQFNGVSNIDNLVLNREIGLPKGIYYYTIILPDLELSYQGFLFLDR